MDHRVGEKEAERNSEDSSDHRRRGGDVDAAAAEEPGMKNHGESMDRQRDGGHEAEEIAAGVLKEVVEVVGPVVGISEEAASAPPLLAHPCSLLRLLLRACAGCLSLHVYCSDEEDAKPAAAADDVPATAVAESLQEEDHGGGGKAASYLRMQEEVVTRVWAVRRRPTAPGRPREGSGGNGGNHH